MLATRFSRAVFNFCHGNNLVYNTCWEDPRLDRIALQLGEGDRLLMITSAGCNALDYALDAPERVDTVDMNLRQNALLDLKRAAIKHLDYPTFFQMFGKGRTDEWKAIYSQLRDDLPTASQEFWDKYGKLFSSNGKRSSFYFHGSSGIFAWVMNVYVNRIAKIRPAVDRLLEAKTLEEQQTIYYNDVKPAFWGPTVRWFLRRDATLSLLGVPKAQRTQLERHYPGGIAKFIEDRLDTVFAELPIHDNYFWRVYMTGEYTPECCPLYLKEEEFHKLKAGLVNCVHTHTNTILDHLNEVGRQYSHFVLLDHMDWMAEHLTDVLAEQWQSIIDHADEGAKILWRSAAMQCEFVDPIEVTVDGQRRRLGDLLEYNRELAKELHAKDRVNTYGNFMIATLRLSQPTSQAATAAADDSSDTAADDSPEPPQNAVPPDTLAHTR